MIHRMWCIVTSLPITITLQWRHNDRHGFPNHRRLRCLLNCWYRPRLEKTSNPVSLAFLGGIHRWPVNSPHKRPVTRKMFPFDDVIMTKQKHSNSAYVSSRWPVAPSRPKRQTQLPYEWDNLITSQLNSSGTARCRSHSLGVIWHPDEIQLELISLNNECKLKTYPHIQSISYILKCQCKVQGGK